jgi:adenylate cyclase
MRAFPRYSLGLQAQINPWRDVGFGQRYIEALRAAGIPE